MLILALVKLGKFGRGDARLGEDSRLLLNVVEGGWGCVRFDEIEWLGE